MKISSLTVKILQGKQMLRKKTFLIQKPKNSEKQKE